MTRETRLTVRLDEAARGQIKEVAKRLDTSCSAVLRLAVSALLDRLPAGALETAIQPELSDADKSCLHEMTLAVNRLGVNVNQLVKKAHREGFTHEVISDLELLHSALAECAADVKRSLDERYQGD